ncbi:MAG: flagellar biosynthetic protein FliR [Phycisphaerae bacterium]
MPLSLLKLHLLLPGFALVLFRVMGLMVTAPLFGSSAIPARIKVALGFTIAALLFPIVGPTLPADITVQTAVAGVAGEMMIGLIIGLSMTLVLVGVQLTGMMIGQQAGIGLASVIDPSQNTSSTVVGQVYMITTLMIFLSIGGHRLLMAALLDTFGVVPVLSFTVSENMVGFVADLLSASYILAIKLFAPVMIALLLTTVALGFLSRTIPQLNILSVGFAVRSMASLGAAALAIGAAQDLLVRALLESLDAIRAVFGLAPVVI